MNSRKLFVLLLVLVSGVLMMAPVQAERPETGSTAKHAYKVEFGDSLPVTVGERTEVWFRYRGTTDGLVQVSTCPTLYDTVLDVYTGRAGAPDILGHADDGDTCTYASNAMYTFQAEKGVTYYFKVTQLYGGFPAPDTQLAFSITSE